MSNKQDTIQVEFEITANEIPADLAAMKHLVGDTCREAGVTSAAISIRIVDDEQMIETHRQYMGKTGTTDVISFDLSDEFERQRSFAMIVNAQMAARQAKRRKLTPEAELALYITHGLLHQLGYDDVDVQQARRMHDREDAILTRHGFGQVFYKNTKSKETD